MSEGKKHCQVNDCTRAAATLCYCCNKSVCTRHFTEHIDAVKAQIDPLANDINSMVENIQTLTVEQLTEPSFAQLHQWRADMHQLVDEIFLAKSKQMEELIEKNTIRFLEHKKQQSEAMTKVQDEVRQLVEDGDATHEQIQSLRNRLLNVEENLTTFRNSFVFISTKVFGQGLVTVSSNLNELMPPPKFDSLNQGSSVETNSTPLFDLTPPVFGFDASAANPPLFPSSPFGSVFGAPPANGSIFYGQQRGSQAAQSNKPSPFAWNAKK